VTISREAFHRLKRGDIILWGDGNLPRIVELGPANWRYSGKGRWRHSLDKQKKNSKNGYLYFSKLRCSWTGRALTCYRFTDVREKISLPRGKHDKKVIRAWLNQLLVEQGIDPRKALIEEAKELKRMAAFHSDWFGRDFVCSAGYTWPK
jgi:hypothetical protein